jgi:putative ABC transport system permease protein
MNTITLGIRNAFRNVMRSISIITILGLSIGLSLVMLIAHQAVAKKIADSKSSIGNTITISPAGFNPFSQANNALTTSQLGNIATMPHVTNVTENLTDRLSTIGSTQPTFGDFGRQPSTNTNNQTSLKSPITLNSNSVRLRTFISGGGSVPVNFSLPITILGTTNPSQINGTAISIGQGSALNGTSNSTDAMVSSNMASKNNLKIGSTFSAYGKKLTVSAIFNSTIQSAQNTIVVALPTEQQLSEQSGVITGAIVGIDSADNLTSVTNEIKNILGSNADVTNSEEQINQVLAPLNSVETITLYSLIGTIIAGCLIILLVMIMIVRERRREIGILKAIGASDARVIFQFMSEAVTLTLAGALIGILLGIIGSSPVTNVLVTSSTNTTTSTGASGNQQFGARFSGGGQGFVARSTSGPGFFGRNANSLTNSVRNVHANVGWNILAYGLAVAILIAVIGSSLAGWLIARIRPSEVMRSE